MNNNMYHWDWIGTEVLICIGAGGEGCKEGTGVLLVTVCRAARVEAADMRHGAMTDVVDQEGLEIMQ